MDISVFVPSHITGFFTIFPNTNPLKKGSCGGGIVIDKGVTTTTKILEKITTEKNEDKAEILINNKKDLKNQTISLKTVELLQNKFKFQEKLLITHDIEVPTGSGFGTSAACALGTAISIKKLLNLPLTLIETYQIAHLAEIAMGSGLGDVIAETSKGVVIRKYPGAPGIGKTENLNDIIKKKVIHNLEYEKKKVEEKNPISEKDFIGEKDSNVFIITKTLGELETSKIIENFYYQKKINKMGIAMEKELIANPSLEKFMECSYNFAIKSKLMNKELEIIVNNLKENTLGASMAMLGNTVFTITQNKKDISEIVDNINSIIPKKNNEKDIIVSEIYNKGIKILN